MKRDKAPVLTAAVEAAELRAAALCPDERPPRDASPADVVALRRAAEAAQEAATVQIEALRRLARLLKLHEPADVVRELELAAARLGGQS